METYEQIIAEITDKIKTNGNKEITGAILQGVLLGIIAAVQANQEEKLEYYSEDTINKKSTIEKSLSIEGQLTVSGRTRCRTIGVDEDLDVQGLTVLNDTDINGHLDAYQGITLNDGNGHAFVITVDAEGNLVSTPKNL